MRGGQELLERREASGQLKKISRQMPERVRLGKLLVFWLMSLTVRALRKSSYGARNARCYTGTRAMSETTEDWENLAASRIRQKMICELTRLIRNCIIM
jgi:hypothetical protein